MKKNFIVNETKQIIANMFLTVSADVSVIMKMPQKLYVMNNELYPQKFKNIGTM